MPNQLVLLCRLVDRWMYFIDCKVGNTHGNITWLNKSLVEIGAAQILLRGLTETLIHHSL